MKYAQIYFILPIILAVASCTSSGNRLQNVGSVEEKTDICDVDDELLQDKSMFKISNHMMNVNENGNYERFELNENNKFIKMQWKIESGVLTSEQLLAEDTEAETDPTGITTAFKEIVRSLETYQVAKVDDDGHYVRDENGRIKYEQPGKLLFYFNGGLNRREDMRWKACEQVPLMLKDGIFPVFMIWPTSFFRSYGDQIGYIRNGKRVGFRPLTAPFYVIRDLGRGIFLTPTNSLSEFNRWVETQRRATRDEFYKVAATLDLNDDSDGHGAPFLFRPGGVVSADSNVLFQAPYGDGKGGHSAPAIDVMHAALWPIRLLTHPFISSFGKTAWENMVRRTRTSVRRPVEYRHDCEIEDAASSNIALSDDQLLDETLLPCGTAPLLANERDTNSLVKLVKKQKDEFPKGIGAFSRFFSMLKTCMGKEKPAASLWICNKYRASPGARDRLREIKLTVIGHSMGGIVLNELLTSYPDLPYEDIVYMGAAASIRSTSRAIVPLLSKAKGDPCCSGPRFFNLMLHPLNEARERSLRGFAPTGSLLAWIDEMYNDPVDMEDRTVGQWKNVRAAKHIFPLKAQERMLFRVFNRQGKDCSPNGPPHPTMHSQFNDTESKFWRPAFWGAVDVGWEDKETAKRLESCPDPTKDG